MLEYLVAEDNLTCEERDRVILRIARENDIAEYMLSNLAGYGRSKQEVLKRAERRKNSELQGKKQDESYISLTEIARAHSEDNRPHYNSDCSPVPRDLRMLKYFHFSANSVSHILEHHLVDGLKQAEFE